MNLAIWDIESSSANTSWGSIIEVGGILVDPNFKELIDLILDVGYLKVKYLKQWL